MENLAFFEAI